LLALPCMAVTAALAVLFETLPLLRSGLGNVLYFFLWTFLLVAPGVQTIDQNKPIPPAAYMSDFAGVVSTMGQMQAEVRSIDPLYKGGSSLNIGNEKGPPSKRFHWRGLVWNRALLLGRVMWTGMAVALTLLAALFFHRFDPSREWRFKAASAVEKRERACCCRRDARAPYAAADRPARQFVRDARSGGTSPDAQRKTVVVVRCRRRTVDRMPGVAS